MMKRCAKPSCRVMVVAGATALAAAALGAICVRGIAAEAGLAVQRDFSNIEMTTTRIADDFYTLDGEGGNRRPLVHRTGSSWWTRSSVL